MSSLPGYPRTAYSKGGTRPMLILSRFLAHGIKTASRGVGYPGYASFRTVIVLAFVIWTVVSIRRYLEQLDFDTSHNFCDDNTPPVQIFDNYLPQGYFRSLQNDTAGLINARQQDKKYFNPEGFGKHLAFAYKFNDEGYQSILGRSDIKYLFPLLSMLRLQKANAFNVRILVGLPGNGTEDVAKDHLDGGSYSDPELRKAGKYREYSVVPYTTSMLYLSIPEDMQGGDTDLHNDDPHKNERRQRWHVQPKENTLVIFRGDIPHTAHGYTTATNKRRTTIVFQQFTLPSRMYKLAEYMDAS